MAGRGPAPTGDRSRDRDNKETVKLVSDGKRRGPALPRNVLKDRAGKSIAWHPMTVRWWNHWRESPQALRMMTGPDWDFLLDTALMHHEMWSAKKWELAAEVRLRVQKFGATPEDRSRLRVEIGVGLPNEAPATVTTNVTSIDDRRQRLTGSDG
jgi:hypothetical protein